MTSEIKLLVIDVETTGFDPLRSACIELGAVALDKDLNTLGEFESVIQPWPGAEISAESVAVSGIDLAQVFKCPTQSEVVQAFRKFCGQSQPTLCGWNVWFDASFLKEMYRRCELTWSFGHRLLDVQSIVAFFCRLHSVSQETVIRKYLHKVQTHRALSDARNTADILRLLYKRRFSMSVTTALSQIQEV